MPLLHEVFGVATSVPKYTYVDRLGLDASFEYYMQADRHIVLHGGSKQGKTVLRRKHLSEAESIIIPCGPDDNLDTIFARILSDTKSTAPSSRTSKSAIGGSVDSELSAEVAFPFFGKAGVKLGGDSKADQSREISEMFLGSTNSIDTVIRAIRSSRRRLVIEDFHYLPEAERSKLAFALKAFYDAKVFVIIVGIWAEQNLLSVYNNDLSGRIEEIDVRWTEAELREVIKKGEFALNIRFASMISDSLITDANENVGLLQRLLEGVCREGAVLETQAALRSIGNTQLLIRCREQVCKGAERRYYTFANFVSRGFKDPEKTKLKLYRQIVRVCIESTDEELIAGIDRDRLLEKIKLYEPQADLQNLQKALIRLDRLQAERSINPPVLSYGELSRRVVLVDREFLFYRKYANRQWPWQAGYDEIDEDDV